MIGELIARVILPKSRPAVPREDDRDVDTVLNEPIQSSVRASEAADVVTEKAERTTENLDLIRDEIAKKGHDGHHTPLTRTSDIWREVEAVLNRVDMRQRG